MAPISSRPDSITKAKVPSTQFILALLLVKSKPSRVSCRDYLLQLRSCIRDEPRPNTTGRSNSHVDATAYWRDSYSKSEEVRIGLQARVAELELRLAALEQPRVAAPAVTVGSSQGKRKRAANEPAEASSSRSQKHARTTKANPTYFVKLTAQGEGLLNLMEEIESSESNPPGNVFPHDLYILQQVLAETRPDPKTLAETLCSISSGICRLISTVKATDGSSIVQPTGAANSSTRKQEKTPATAPNTPDEEVTNQLHAVGQAFPCLLNGLERLDHLPQGRTIKGQIIWSFVKIFHDVLERICYLSATPAYERPTPMPARMPTRAQALQHSIAISDGFPAAAGLHSQCQACQARNIRCDGGVSECRNCREAKRECKRGVPLDFADTTITRTLFTPPTKYVLRLCEFAIVLMAHLDTTKATHEEVMEGFLFFLMRRLGQGLKTFTIGNQADWGTEEDESQAAADNRGSETQEVMEAQAPCLIWIFEQAQALVSPHQITQISKNVRRRPSAASLKSLSTIEQNRFQNTLLKAVFGDRVSAEYRPALTPPSSPLDDGFFGRLAGDLKERDIKVKDWFKYEVWRLVGWDCLRGKIQWDKD